MQDNDCETVQGLLLVHTNNVKRKHHTEKVRWALRSITSAGNNILLEVPATVFFSMKIYTKLVSFPRLHGQTHAPTTLKHIACLLQ